MHRRRSRYVLLLARAAARIALVVIRHWQTRNPNVADYRATQALEGLRTSVSHLGHLHRGTHTANWHAARARFTASLEATDPRDGERP